MADEIARLKVVIDAEDNASAVIDRVSGKVGSVSGVSAQTAKGLKGVTKELDTTADKWISAGKAINSYGKDLDTITKPLQVAAVGAIAGGVAVAKMAMDYESAFIKVKKTVNGTPEQLAKLDKEIKALSDDIPVNSTELANLAAVGGQLGIAVDDISKFTEVMAAIGTATNLQGEDGAATIARFMNVMGEETKNVDRVGSAIVELGNNTATTEAEIAAMAQRMGGFGKTVGMNTSQVLGYSAALSSLGVEAQLGGSALGRTWLNIEASVNKGGKELAAYAKYAGVSAKQFAKQWSDDPSGAFNGLIKGLSSVENLTGALDELGIENIQDQHAVLKLANNYELMAKSLDLSSNAYKDNTALMKEAETAYASTANQLKLALNDIQDAAISWGNVLLPEISKGAQWVGNVAKSFENMSDAQKKTVISGAKAAVVLGATTKVATGAIKGIGNTVEAIGNIKKATAAGGALAKFGPALASVASVAGPVALGIAGVTAAVVVGKKAYDTWYDSQYRWAQGLDEGNQKVAESLQKYKDLTSIQSEVKDLRLVIDNPKSSQEQVNNAKSRIEEIKTLLQEEYDLVINVDDDNLQETVENIRQISKNELQLNINEQQDKLNSLEPNAEKYRKNIDSLEKKAQQDSDDYVKYNTLLTKFETAGKKFQNQKISEEEYLDSLVEIGTQIGFNEDEIRNYGVIASDIERDLLALEAEKKDAMTSSNKKVADLKATYKEYAEAATQMADYSVQMLGIAVKEGDTESVIENVNRISDNVKNADLDISKYAKNIVEEISGIKLDGEIADSFKVLDQYKNVEMSFNAESNLLELKNEADEVVASIDGKTGTITILKDSTEVDNYKPETKTSTVKFGVDHKEVDDYNPDKQGKIFYTPVIGTPIGNTKRFWEPQAKGTQNFGGGLAMVNDQTGISDPRELIIDNGRAFIPQGRNVILPLSKGAKVYTATQTKAIMSRLGIPQYAKGKDNSDAFTSARDDWSHTTNIRAVSVSEELEKWVEFSKKFASNVKDANDIQEKIYSLSLKQRDEMNENSEDYILTRARMNDWQAYGDTAIDAFNRVRNRERQYVAEGKVLEKDSHKYLEELGSDMFDARVKNSKWWLDHEREYNSLSTQDYMAGLNRMRAYTEEYYKNGIISAEEYYSTLQMISDMHVDETRKANDKEYESWKKSADGYYEQRMLYDDWDEFGDSPEQFFERCIQRQEEFHKAQKISWEEANEAIIGYNMDLYRAQQDEFDSLLNSYDKYIDKVNDRYDELISKKREAYETKNLKQDLADAQAERDKYAGAVTQKGKDVYNQAVKDIEEIQFEMEINDIEKEQTRVVSDLKSNYETVEKDKKKILAAVKGSGINLEGYTSLIKEDGSNIANVLSQIYSVVKGLQPVYETKYGDTTVNVSANLPNVEGWFRYATNAIAG